MELYECKHVRLCMDVLDVYRHGVCVCVSFGWYINVFSVNTVLCGVSVCIMVNIGMFWVLFSVSTCVWAI